MGGEGMLEGEEERRNEWWKGTRGNWIVETGKRQRQRTKKEIS